MFNNKLVLVLGGYIMGSVISNMFSGKKGETFRSELKQTQEDGGNIKGVLLAEFIKTHKNFLKELKEVVLTDENKIKFHQKMDEVKLIIKDYGKEGEKLIEELKEKGGEYAVEAGHKLEELYYEKKEELEEIASHIPGKITKMKGKLLEKYDEMKKKI